MAVNEAVEIIQRTSTNGKKFAVVFDIDDTVGLRRPYKSIRPVRALYRWLRKEHPEIDLFFVSARPDNQNSRKETVEYLLSRGYEGWKGLYLVGNRLKNDPAIHPFNDPTGKGRRKADVREYLEDMGYTILLNIGDKPTDHIHGHFEHSIKLPELGSIEYPR